MEGGSGQNDQKYVGSTAAQLDHYYKNNVGVARLKIQMGDPAGEIEQARQDMIGGLERTIEQDLPEFDGITNENLQAMIDIAKQGEWTDEASLVEIQQKYKELRENRSN